MSAEGHHRETRTTGGASIARRPGLSVAGAVASPYPDRALLRVAVSFTVLYALLQTAAWAASFRGSLDWLMRTMADVTGTIANMTGVPALVAGNEVFLASRVLRIDFACTGWSSVMVYIALVLAYPLSPRRKTMGLAVGIPVLLLANIGRLAAVAHLSSHLGDDAFLFAHDYFFRIVMIGVVIAIWGVYLARARRHASQ